MQSRSMRVRVVIRRIKSARFGRNSGSSVGMDSGAGVIVWDEESAVVVFGSSRFDEGEAAAEAARCSESSKTTGEAGGEGGNSSFAAEFARRSRVFVVVFGAQSNSSWISSSTTLTSLRATAASETARSHLVGLAFAETGVGCEGRWCSRGVVVSVSTRVAVEANRVGVGPAAATPIPASALSVAASFSICLPSLTASAYGRIGKGSARCRFAGWCEADFKRLKFVVPRRHATETGQGQTTKSPARAGQGFDSNFALNNVKMFN